MDSMPTELDEINRKIMQHEIEETALKKETDKLAQAHLAEIQKELAELRDSFKAMKAKWENEKQSIDKVRRLREEIEQVSAQLEKAENEYDLNRAAEEDIPWVLKGFQNEIAGNNKDSALWHTQSRCGPRQRSV